MAKWGKKGFGFQISALFNRKPKSFGKRASWSSTLPKKTKPIQWGKKSTLGTLFQSSGNAKGFGSRTKVSAVKWGSGKPVKISGKPVGRKIRLGKFLILMLCFMLIMLVPSFIFIEKNLRPPLMHVAKIKVKQIATQAINRAITEQVARSSNTEKLIDWKMNANGKISGFMLNYGEHMRITSATIETVQSELTNLQDIPEHIPLGHALNSAIISSFGPRIPVRFEPQGAVKVELSTRQKNAGINMILVEVYIRVIAELTIIIPFDTEPELVETDIPISYLLVVGDVPMYYYDNTGKPIGESAPQAPNISVPMAPGSSGGVTMPGTAEEQGEQNSSTPVLTEPLQEGTGINQLEQGAAQ